VAITWEDWFDEFEKAGLAFIYQEETPGGDRSSHHELVGRETVDDQI
jgi:hypothetical protein